MSGVQKLCVTVVGLLGVAGPFAGFLVPPLAVLLLFCVGFAASERRYRDAR